MSRANPLWGVPRIHGELLKLGIEISEPTWRTFLENHVQGLVSVGFFTVSTIRFSVRWWRHPSTGHHGAVFVTVLLVDPKQGVNTSRTV